MNAPYKFNSKICLTALRFIDAYGRERAYAYAPTLREIGAAVGTTSTGHSKYVLDMLERHGMVELPRLPSGERIPRTIIITPRGRAELDGMK